MLVSRQGTTYFFYKVHNCDIISRLQINWQSVCKWESQQSLGSKLDVNNYYYYGAGGSMLLVMKWNSKVH